MAKILRNGMRLVPHTEPSNGKKDLAQRLESADFKPVLDVLPSPQFARATYLVTSEGISIPLGKLPSGATELMVVPMSSLYLGRTPEQNEGFVLYFR